MARSRTRERISFGRAEDLGGLEFLRASYDGHQFSKHFHDTFSIGFVETGVNAFRLGARSETAFAGSLSIVHPGEVHTGGTNESWSYRNVYPSAETVREVAFQATGRAFLPEFARGVVTDPRAVALFLKLFGELASPSTPLAKETRLVELLAHLVVQHAAAPATRPPADDPPAVSRAREYLHAHAAEPISLRALAGAAGASPFHLVRLFRRATGLPPHAYLVQVRLGRARALLAGGATPTDAAADTGFADQAHLTRTFKAAYGVTPGRVREARNFVQDGEAASVVR